MALASVRSASKIQVMADVAFFANYVETSRIVGFFPERTDTVAGRILDLYQRHASAVCGAFDKAIAAHAADLRQGELLATCLFSVIVNQEDSESCEVLRPTGVEQAHMIGSEIQIAIDEGEPGHHRPMGEMKW